MERGAATGSQGVMAIPILVFYHCLFQIEGQLLPPAINIVSEQMQDLKQCGLEESASEIYVGVNGGDEATAFSELFPAKATVVYHGLACRNENRTIQLIEERLKKLDGEAYVCYLMAKGASFPAGDDFRTRWRNRMQHHVVTEWRKCVKALDGGYEVCGCHYLTPEQYPGLVGFAYMGGNFWWGRASYLKTLSPISESPAVKQHGIDAFESRYEAESFLGHGPRRPKAFDFHPGWPG